MGKDEQENPELVDFKGQDNTKGLGYKGIRLSKVARRRFLSMNNLSKNVRPLKNSFIKEGKRKFYLREEEPVKVAGVSVPGFEIFKEKILESLARNNKEKVMKKAAEKMGIEAIEELLCLPPNKEPP